MAKSYNVKYLSREWKNGRWHYIYERETDNLKFTAAEPVSYKNPKPGELKTDRIAKTEIAAAKERQSNNKMSVKAYPAYKDSNGTIHQDLNYHNGNKNKSYNTNVSMEIKGKDKSDTNSGNWNVKKVYNNTSHIDSSYTKKASVKAPAKKTKVTDSKEWVKRSLKKKR